MKNIGIKHHRRDVKMVGYQVDVATDNPAAVRSRLERFDVHLREYIALAEPGHHRYTVSVAETPHISADARLDALMGILAETRGVVEVGRQRLNPGDVREVLFELTVEATYLEYDVRRHLALAAGVGVSGVRYLDGGTPACLKCDTDWAYGVDRCERCGFIGSPERRSRACISLRVMESPDTPAEQRLQPALSVIRSAKGYKQFSLKRIDPDGNPAAAGGFNPATDPAELAEVG